MNYEQLPVKRCLFMVNNYELVGQVRMDGNGGGASNYFSNSIYDIRPDFAYQGLVCRWFNSG